MADDLSSKLKAILDNPEMMKLIGNMAQSMGSGSNTEGNSTNSNSNSSSNAEASSNFAGASAPSGSDDMASTIKNAIDRLGGSSDNRITLLNALKPYMRASRTQHIDMAIRILKMSKLTGIFKDL